MTVSPRFIMVSCNLARVLDHSIHGASGQEQGLSGGQTPNNHEAWVSGYTHPVVMLTAIRLWHTRYDPEHPLYAMVTALNQARKAAITSEKYFLTTSVSS